ncbi:unnamed protein product [Diamesa serratosioi]
MDAVNDDYAEYRAFLSKFLKTIDPLDQLPFRVAGYCLKEQEVYGEVLDWLMVYLSFPKNCPITLKNYLMQTSLKRTLEKCKSSPKDCGFDEERQIYQPLKLVRVVTQTVNELVRELEDNAKLYEVPLPPTSANASELSKIRQPPKFSTDAIKNARRTMEDRHVIVNDFNTLFNVQDTEPTFYYGIFDGHNGTDAATYANSHLNYNISVHPKYPVDIETAIREAFLTTDMGFLKKAKTENLNSGTTALCAIYRKLEKKLYVGWCGDSQALIARLGNVRQIVKKHSPEEVSERIRIEKLGGCILYWSGSYRVNGSLAVSRAIGDIAHKPFVSAEPDVEVIDLDGDEDFVVLGCDGLWDNLTEDDVALTIYTEIKRNPDNYQSIATDLCTFAKAQGSRDNISVIVVYLKDPHLIATQTWPSAIQQNITTASTKSPDHEQEEMPSPELHQNVLILNNDNNNNSGDNQFDGHDFGPETDVDAIDMMAQLGNMESAMKEQIQSEFKETEDFTDQNVVIGESGGEESEDEWNYIKVDKKLDVETVVEETHEQIIAESPSVEEILLKEQLETEKIEQLTDRDIITEESEILEKKIQVLDSPLEAEKDLTVEKEVSEEESQLEEEKQSREEVEKDLQLDEEIDIDCDKISAEEMASQLNPDAKEFVPVSPVRSGHSSPFENGNGMVNPMLTNLDDVVSQSPRKGEFQQMDNIQVPDENDFDQEANSRPHEVKQVGQNGNHKRSDSFGSNGYEELNLKESMQRDDKLDYEYKDEIEQSSAPSAFFEESQISIQANFGDDTMASDYKQLESSFDQYSSTFSNKIDDPMNRSFYEGRDDNIMSEFAAQSSDILNKVQPIPSFDDFETLDQRPEADHAFGESDKPESDLIEEGSVTKMMDTSDQFESENFVENIKSGNGVFDKYNECGLSPTEPDFATNLVQTVHETFMNDKPVMEKMNDITLESMVNLIDNTQAESDICMQSNDMKDIPETMEPPPTPAVGFEPEFTENNGESVDNLADNLEVLKIDDIKPKEVLAAAAAAVITAGIAAVGIDAAKKKPVATKTEVKKAPAKTNSVPAKTNPVTAKSNPVPAKRVVSTATKATAPTKPIAVASKTTAIKVSSAGPARTLPTKPTATAARPLSASSVPPAIKKTVTSTLSANKSSIEAKPTPATRTAMVPKKPLTSSTTSTAAKAPVKPTPLATKPKLTNGASSVKATSPTKPMSSARLSMSTVGAAEKSTKDAANKQVLNRSVGSASATTRASPRPATAIKKTIELKSPAGAKTTITSTRTTTLSAVGARKPLSTTTSRTTTSTLKKSPTGKAAPQPAPIAKKPSPIGRQPINKTTTTTTVEKKVMNGDVVKEQIITTTTTTGSDNFEDLLKEQLVMEMNGMNGHQNGDLSELIKENGGDAKEGDIINNMMVIDSAAD